MKEDELAKTLKKYAETINTLNKNQQVLVKEVDGLKQSAEVNKRVEDIIKQTQAKTAAATPPAPVAAPAVAAPTPDPTPAAKPAAKPAAPAPADPAPAKPKEGE